MRASTIVQKISARLVVSGDGVASVVFRDPIRKTWHSVSMPFDVMFDDEFAHDSLESALESVDMITLTEVDDSGETSEDL